jgi:hypothetical protein
MIKSSNVRETGVIGLGIKVCRNRGRLIVCLGRKGPQRFARLQSAALAALALPSP